MPTSPRLQHAIASAGVPNCFRVGAWLPWLVRVRAFATTASAVVHEQRFLDNHDALKWLEAVTDSYRKAHADFRAGTLRWLSAIIIVVQTEQLKIGSQLYCIQKEQGTV